MDRQLKFDAVDIQILRALQKDARISNKSLAAMVHLAPSTCLERVKRLRRTGVIVGFRLEVSPEKLGRPLEALLLLRMEPHKRALFDPFVEHVLAQPETRALYHLAGREDFLVHVALQNTDDLQRVILDQYTTREEITLVHTNLIFQKWKGGPLLPISG